MVQIQNLSRDPLELISQKPRSVAVSFYLEFLCVSTGLRSYLLYILGTFLFFLLLSEGLEFHFSFHISLYPNGKIPEIVEFFQSVVYRFPRDAIYPTFTRFPDLLLVQDKLRIETCDESPYH